MTTSLTIGQLAQQTGVPAKTIRFYEEIGLIVQPERSSNGYRTYPESRIAELVLIKNVRALGLSIPQIKRLMLGCPGGDCSHSAAYIDKEITEYTKELTTKIDQMTHLRTQLQKLRQSIVACNGDHDCTYCCNVLGQIAELSKGGETK